MIAKGNYQKGNKKGWWNHYCEHGKLQQKLLWENKHCKKIIHFFYNEETTLVLNFKEGITEDEKSKYQSIINECVQNQLEQYRLNDLPDSLIHTGFLHYRAANFRRKKIMSNKFTQVPFMDSLISIEDRRNNSLKELCESTNYENYLQLYFGYDELFHHVWFDGKGRNFEAFYILKNIYPYNLELSQFFENSKRINKIYHLNASDTQQRCLRYFENGRISSAGEYKKGLRVGEWSVYSDSGLRLRIETYKKNRRVKIEAGGRTYYSHEFDEYIDRYGPID